MTAYTKSTNFATKDTLTSGDPLKIVKGTEINTEFDNIATAVNSKSDTASPTFTGTVTIPILSYAGTTLSAAVTGTGKMVLDTSPTLVTPALGTPASGVLTNCTGVQYTGFKNRIINGAMVIDQRNTGTSFTVPNANGYGSCDRWASLAGATSTWTMQRVSSGLANFAYALQAGRNASSSSTSILYIGQVIETNNCQDLAGQSVTLSFYAKAGANFSASSSALIVELWTGSGTDQGWASLGSATWTSQASTISTSKVLTTTYQQFTSTATVPAGTNEIAIRIWYAGVGTAGANDWFQITGVQLEKGSTATSFDYRPYGTELALCQRYYEKSGQYYVRGDVNSVSHYTPFFFKTTKRTTPTSVTLTLSYGGTGSGGAAVNSMADGFEFLYSVGATASSSYAGVVYAADSEL